MKTCFVIMPFHDQFDDIVSIIKQAAKDNNLEYVRSDLGTKPGNIMAQIHHEIKRAAVVVADITGSNPNVFYELGIAHHILGPERVVIINQNIDPKIPFDVHQYRQLDYKHSTPGREKLALELRKRIQEAKEESAGHAFWNVTRGRLQRTLMLVGHLQRLIDSADPQGLEGTTIRVFANLSSLSISEEEPEDPILRDGYRTALLAERDALRKVLLLGARLKAVLNPPRHFTEAMLPDRLSARYRRLIKLVESPTTATDYSGREDDVKIVMNSEFALSPVPMPNLFIIGNEAAYEGMKRSSAGGFDMTHCETEKEELHELINQFDRCFEESRREMCRTHPPDGCFLQQLKAFYLEAQPKRSTQKPKGLNFRTS